MNNNNDYIKNFEPEKTTKKAMIKTFGITNDQAEKSEKEYNDALIETDRIRNILIGAPLEIPENYVKKFPEMDADIIPKHLQEINSEFANYATVKKQVAFNTYITCISASIGSNVSIETRSMGKVINGMYSFVVSPSGSRKSTIQSMFVKELNNASIPANKANQEYLDAKMSGDKKVGLLLNRFKVVVSNITPAAISVVAEQMHNGFLLESDEISSSLFSSIIKDQDFKTLILRGYEGDSYYSKVTKNNGDNDIKKLSLFICGNTTQDGFEGILEDNSKADGLTARFQFINFGDTLYSEFNRTSSNIGKYKNLLRKQLSNLLDTFNVTVSKLGSGISFRPMKKYKMDILTESYFHEKCYTKIYNMKNSNDSEAVLSRRSRMSHFILRLALIFHCTKDPSNSTVSMETVKEALNFLPYCIELSEFMHGDSRVSNELYSVAKVVSSYLVEKISDRTSASEISYRSRKIKGKNNIEALNSVIEILCEHNHIKEIKTNNQSTRSFLINKEAYYVL